MIAPFRTIRPGADEYPAYAADYVARVPDGDVVDILSSQLVETMSLLRSIPESKADYRYAPEKWSIKEVVGHLSDAERVFAYRALRFSRADTTPVEGFDENTFVANAPFTQATLENLTNELEHLRRSTIHLFANLGAEAMDRRGIANGQPVSVRALAFIIAGHETRHLNTLRTRYLDQKAG
jgi:DinB superfamily